MERFVRESTSLESLLLVWNNNEELLPSIALTTFRSFCNAIGKSSALTWVGLIDLPVEQAETAAESLANAIVDCASLEELELFSDTGGQFYG